MLLHIGYPQRPLPSWLMPGPEVGVQIENRIRDNVLFLGVEENGVFVPKATGFFVSIGTKFGNVIHLVTAEHVIAALGAKGHNTILVRGNTPDGVSVLKTADIKQFRFHPNAEADPTDVAVAPATLDGTLRFLAIDTSAFIDRDTITTQEFGVGDEIFVVGLFRNHYGRGRNIPLVRIGNLAALPEEPVQTKWGYMDAYLVELHSIGGLSGSPVYIHHPPVRVRDKALQYARESGPMLLGLMSGHFDLPNLREDAVIEDADEPGSINTGVGVVVPAYKILETLNHPELVAMREEAIKREEAKAATPDAVGVSAKAPPTKGENPQHREDFNQLLDAAARGSKPSPEKA